MFHDVHILQPVQCTVYGYTSLWTALNMVIAVIGRDFRI